MGENENKFATENRKFDSKWIEEKYYDDELNFNRKEKNLRFDFIETLIHFNLNFFFYRNTSIHKHYCEFRF